MMTVASCRLSEAKSAEFPQRTQHPRPVKHCDRAIAEFKAFNPYSSLLEGGNLTSAVSKIHTLVLVRCCSHVPKLRI